MLLIPVLLLGGAIVAGEPAPLAADALACFREGRIEQARPLFVKARCEGADAATCDHYLGRILLLQREYEDALTLLESAARASPDQAEFQFWMGVACAQHVADVGAFGQLALARKARSCFDRACMLEPKVVHARLSLVRFLVEAPRIAGGNLDRARREADVLATLAPDMGAAVHGAISTAGRGLRLERSRYQSQVEESPFDPPPRYQLGMLQLHVGAWEEAWKTFSAWLRDEPESRLALYQLGRTGALSGTHIEEATAALERYATISPGLGEPPAWAARWRLGELLVLSGEVARARAEFEAAVMAAPDFVPARESLARATSR